MAINLKSLTRTRSFQAPRMVIYSESGCGKSTMASEANNPLFLVTEDGQGELEIARWPQKGAFQTWDEFMEAVDAAYEQEHDFTELVIDRFDFVERLAGQEVLRQDNRKSLAENCYSYDKGDRRIDDVMAPLFAKLDRIRSDRGMAIVLLCHKSIRKIKDPEIEAYDRAVPDLSKFVLPRVVGWADFVLMLKKEARVVKDDAGFNNTRARAVGTAKRVLCTEGGPSFESKRRLMLPNEIQAPKGQAWSSLMDAMNAALSASTQPQQPQHATKTEAV